MKPLFLGVGLALLCSTGNAQCVNGICPVRVATSAIAYYPTPTVVTPLVTTPVAVPPAVVQPAAPSAPAVSPVPQQYYYPVTPYYHARRWPRWFR